MSCLVVPSFLKSVTPGVSISPDFLYVCQNLSPESLLRVNYDGYFGLGASRVSLAKTYGSKLNTLATALPSAFSDKKVQTGSIPTKVKICGVTNVEDAKLASSAGASYVGMILWPKAKRSISYSLAAEISAATRDHGAEPVGVFVDESAEEIVRACQEAGIAIAQLHGDVARSSLIDLPSWLKVTCVLHANKDGMIKTPVPKASEDGAQIDWILVDGMQGGSGETFEWSNLRLPQGVSREGWMLAGGLHPANVATAVMSLRPHVVDVSSGVTGPDKLAKDKEKVHAFLAAVRGAVAGL